MHSQSCPAGTTWPSHPQSVQGYTEKAGTRSQRLRNILTTMAWCTELPLIQRIHQLMEPCIMLRRQMLRTCKYNPRKYNPRQHNHMVKHLHPRHTVAAPLPPTLAYPIHLKELDPILLTCLRIHRLKPTVVAQPLTRSLLRLNERLRTMDQQA